MNEFFFISYSRAEAGDFAIKLADELASGLPVIRVFLDQRELRPGEQWDDQLAEAIKTCEALLFVVNSDSVHPESVCKNEWVRALKCKKPVIPLLLDPDAELPFSLGLRGYIDFTGTFEAGLAHLRKHLAWFESPAGRLQMLKHRLSDAQREVIRAAPPQRARIQEEIIELQRKIAQLQRVIDNPPAVARPAPSSRGPLAEEALGIQGFTADDKHVVAGSRFSAVRDAIFANPYQKIWRAQGNALFERFPVTLMPLLKGMLFGGTRWQFLAAAKRVLASDSDLRWGQDGKGFRRLLHPNGICMIGLWEVTEETPYTGYFRKGSRGLMIVRYSTCCTETRRGNTRSLSMIGRIYPTTDPDHLEPLPTACFITQQDIGGENTPTINEARLRNAPNTTVSRRGGGMPILLLSGLVFNIAEKQPTIRQVYQIAELGKSPAEPTRAPEFMQLTIAPGQPVIPGDDLDFRDEIMAHLYDLGDPTPKRKLVFDVETSDTGTTYGTAIKERREITNWKKIGTMTFDAAVVSFNGDRVFHVNHPAWREDRNDPRTVVRSNPRPPA